MRKYLLRISLATATCPFGLALAEAGHQVGALRGCQHSNAHSAHSAHTCQARPEQGTNARGPKSDVWIGDILTHQATLAYEGYTLERRSKKLRIDYPPEAESRSSIVDVSYARLKRHGRTVATFDANVHFGSGNDTRFGLFPLLGGGNKQLIVSQDISRGGTQCFQDKMSISEIPLPEIIFKYEQKSGKYLPANRLFSEYALRNVIAEARGVDSSDESFARSSNLYVLLDFIYAGKQKEGWVFFDRRYKLSDKAEVERRVKSVLNAEPVYKFIYKYANER